ncbi:MAG: DUF3299 domain-containing protein [Oligoflexales bacterium]
MQHLKKPLLWGAVIVIPALGIVLGTMMNVDETMPAQPESQAERVAEPVYETLSWKQLKGGDQTTGENAPVSELDNKPVMIKGFVVPLDDEAETYNQFLLVPTVQACIHVPPPPSNQMILVEMDADKAPKRSPKAVLIKGILQVAKTEAFFGTVAYKMTGLSTEGLNEEAMNENAN